MIENITSKLSVIDTSFSNLIVFNDVPNLTVVNNLASFVTVFNDLLTNLSI